MKRWLITLGLILAAGHCTAESSTQALSTLLKQWLGLERQTDRLQQDWQQQSTLLQQRLQLLQHEKNSLKKQLGKHSGRQSKVQEQRKDLAEKQNVLEKNQQLLERALLRSEAKLKQVLTRLPAPLATNWQEKFNRLNKKKSALSSSQQLDSYLSMLKALQEFQNKITRHQQIMTINGNEVLVDQLYFGVAQGWYLSRDKQLAGFGRPDTEQWRWHSDNTLASMLNNIFKALESPDNSELLPIKIHLAEAEI